MGDLSVWGKICVSVLPILFAITLHEVAHGWVASLFGDQTARLSGRLTLNPAKHIDPLGTIIVPVLMLVFANFIFGWAKPVPVDARNLRNPRWNMVIVALAGPLSNFLMALIWAAIAKGALMFVSTAPWLEVFFWMGETGIMINVVFGVLNLLPIPPLDGGRILINLLPSRIGWHVARHEQTLFILLVLLMVSGLLVNIILPPITHINQWVANLFLLP